jgi:hypothetical protein
MSTSTLKNIESLAAKFNNNTESIALELKRIQSVKCRLKKQKARKDYDSEMRKTLEYEQALKEARSLLTPSKKHVTEFDQNDVNDLDYDETIKAIKSIQSKKCLTKLEKDDPNDCPEYVKACQIEEMLLEHKKQVAPIEDTTVRKTDVKAILEQLESQSLSQEAVTELLKKLM